MNCVAVHSRLMSSLTGLDLAVDLSRFGRYGAVWAVSVQPALGSTPGIHHLSQITFITSELSRLELPLEEPLEVMDDALFFLEYLQVVIIVPTTRGLSEEDGRQAGIESDIRERMPKLHAARRLAVEFSNGSDASFDTAILRCLDQIPLIHKIYNPYSPTVFDADIWDSLGPLVGRQDGHARFIRAGVKMFGPNFAQFG